ncbi:MAG: MMPL family transporter [Candidatus Izemoplasmatales bacterium]|jgi:predicted RND superfamily exporter protein|nr:MMPL family transporter [Candidatus Izemoplasmatales bacterium]
MKKLLTQKGKWITLIVSFLFLVISIIFAFQVKVNYDMTEYLANDSETSKGLIVLDETFGNNALVELMVKDITIEESLTIKNNIKNIDGVLIVSWLDDYVDPYLYEYVDPSIVEQFYKENNALFQIVLKGNTYETYHEDTIKEINTLLEEKESFMRGEVLENIEARNIAENELIKIILLILPICFIILIFASRSWLEPLLILGVLGVAVIFNLGTNALLPNVSFITLTLSSALQLAISLDYSIFFIHRYYEYRDQGLVVNEAINLAFKKSLPVISASALTTMVGFLALLFMRYKIGMDIGIVLSKGIFFSYLATVFLLPVVILITHKLLDKLRHRHFMFNLSKLNPILIKFRYLFIGLFIILLGLGVVYQSKSEYLYGSSEYSGEDSIISKDKIEIKEYFEEYSSVTLLLKNSDKTQELSLLQELSSNEHIKKIDALYLVIDINTPPELIPDYILSQYVRNDYTRISIYTDLLTENDEMFEFASDLNNDVDNLYDDYYILGMISSTAEIKDMVTKDTMLVFVLSILFIAIILFIIFRNILIPIILLLVIQSAVWFNVGLLAINDRTVVYIGYLVVFALQLGATIDYGVLYASRYIEYRKNHVKNDAMYNSIKNTSIPIMISGIVLAAAGFTEMIFSDIKVVSDIGLLIGRGALLSAGFVLFFLPCIIYIFDKVIIKKEKK